MPIPPQFVKGNKKKVVDSKAEDAAEGPEDGKPDAEDKSEGETPWGKEIPAGKPGAKSSKQKAGAKRAMLLAMAKKG
jgi:hypothetical protein